jgi:type II secretory pathway component PulF
MIPDFNNLERSFAVFMFKSDTKARVRLWRKLGKMLRDGIPIIVAMEEIKALRGKGDPLGAAMGEWSAVMKNGRKLSEAAKEWVTTEEAMLLMAGEQSGTLPEAMASVVTVTKSKKSIQSAIFGGVAYPFFLVLMSFGVMYLFNFKIIPAFTRAVRGESWIGMAKTMVDASAFAQNWLHWIAVALIVCIVAFFVSLPIWSGPSRTYIDRFPPYSIYRVMQGSSWIIALSALIQAGVRIDSALAQLSTSASPWAKVRIDAALRGLRAGRNLGEALQQSGYEFPDREIISDIRVYSTKSGFDEALRLIGDEWITESVERIESLMAKVFSATLLLAAGIIAFEVSGLLAMQWQLSQIMQHTGR